MITEAQCLHRMGCGVHWLRPNSKAPVRMNWAKAEPQSWRELAGTYQKGYGLGIALGKNSPLGGRGFLANIDVDVKGGFEYRDAALGMLARLLPTLDLETCPCVETGYGFRYFVRTTEPVASGKLAVSDEWAKVLMPTSPVPRDRPGGLTTAEVKAGWRVRPAWEIEFMSAGRQVVVPPTIHPDTKSPYIWLTPFDRVDNLPWVAPPVVRSPRGGRRKSGEAPQVFTPVDVAWDDSRFSDHLVAMLTDDSGDRSARLLGIASALLKARFSVQETVSILTDNDQWPIAQIGYDHRQTDDRWRAADWIHTHTVRKAYEELSAEAVFASEVVASEPLNETEAKTQAAELFDATSWETRIKRSGKEGMGNPLPTLFNTVLILTHNVAKDVFRRDELANRDVFGLGENPWGCEPGAWVSDKEDFPKITHWLSRTWGYEPKRDVLLQAVTVIGDRNRFHSVRDELRALPPWDGVVRLDTWLVRHFEARGEPEYLAQVLRKWMVGSVKRTFEPGSEIEWMPIFQGNQGIGKSNFSKFLFGKRYYRDSLPPLGTRDAEFSLGGMRVVEFGELATLSKTDLGVAKAFITRTHGQERPLYNQLEVVLPRQCVFVGTTNLGVYLRDDTGNRRFMPVEVGRLNFERLFAEREQLWAEALFIYDNELEDTLKLTAVAREFSETIQAEKMVENEDAFIEHALCKWVAGELEKPELERVDFGRVQLVPLFAEAWGPLAKFKQGPREIQCAARILRKYCAAHRVRRGRKYWTLSPECQKSLSEGC